MPSHQESPFLIVGLGNPGSKYESTLHNLGFMVVDELSRRWGSPTFSAKFQALVADASSGLKTEFPKVLLIKPQTFMNLSGNAVGEVKTFFKIPPENIFVITDDLDLPPGALRLRPSGGSGGHNGLKSIIQVVGSEGFPRLRIGIGRHPEMEAKGHVLGKIAKADKALFEEALVRAADAVESCLKIGVEKSMNTFNQKVVRQSDGT